MAVRNQGTKTLKQELEKGSTKALVVPQVGNPEVGHQYRTPEGVTTSSARRLYQCHSPQTPLKKWQFIMPYSH